MTTVTMVWIQNHANEVRNANKAVLSYLAFRAHYDNGLAAWPAMGTMARTGPAGLQRHRSRDRRTDSQGQAHRGVERDMQGLVAAVRAGHGRTGQQRERQKHPRKGKKNQRQNVTP